VKNEILNEKNEIFNGNFFKKFGYLENYWFPDMRYNYENAQEDELYRLLSKKGVPTSRVVPKF
jgi:hypothetical protein